jgi:L-malate glycosyltransferase
MRIDQLIPNFHHGDAIGDTAFHMKKYLKAQGFQSEIYCLERDKGLENSSELISAYQKPGAQDVTILHYALPSPLTDVLLNSPGKKAIIYHNITPSYFFRGFSREMVKITDLGREELKKLVPHVQLALADSEFNQQELQEYGFKNTQVFPLFIDFDHYKQPLNKFYFDLFKDERVNILFVGRIVPNKKIDELIKVTFYYKKYISPLVRLIVVGKTSSLPKYYQSLVRMADEFYLQPQEICFTGHVSDDEMFALYKASDVFLSLSEHEGFGLPFIESMIFDLPIAAYDCTAVPGTLGDAGVLIKDKSVDRIGELIYILAHDKSLKKEIVSGQRRRLKRYKKEMDLKKELLKIMDKLF